MSDHHERQRVLAYRLWEEAGCPDGRADEFWYQAIEILTAETRPPEEEEDTAAAAPEAEVPPPAAAAPAPEAGASEPTPPT